jgi:uncharacterized protein Smg (DUF494 family)
MPGGHSFGVTALTRRRAGGQVAFRVLGPHERGRFSAEAWGHLLALTGAGFLSPAELEQVIDRALSHIDGRIGLDDVRTLLEGAGLEDAGAGPEPMTIH